MQCGILVWNFSMEIGKESKWESKCEDLMRKLERAKDINK